MYKTATTLGAALLLTLAGCASTTGGPTSGPGPTGVNHLASTTGQPDATSEPSYAVSDAPTTQDDTKDTPAEDTPTEASSEVAFGKTYTYEDGLSVTVSKPSTYHPTRYAAVTKKSPHYVTFKVTVVNKTAKKVDLTLFNATVQSSSEEAEAVFDSEGGLEGSPSTSLLKGRESTFKIGFGVQDPKDIVMDVAPDFDHDTATFTN